MSGYKRLDPDIRQEMIEDASDLKADVLLVDLKST